MRDREAIRAAEELRRSLGRDARRHVETYIRHLERIGDDERLARWRTVAEVIERDPAPDTEPAAGRRMAPAASKGRVSSRFRGRHPRRLRALTGS
jgi:hypothetical protein